MAEEITPPAFPVSAETQARRDAGEFRADTSAEKQQRRATVESKHNQRRHNREMQYIADKNKLEADYQFDLKKIREDKEKELNEVGLNRDGSDPRDRQQGLAV
jgi:hypothetical protein